MTILSKLRMRRVIRNANRAHKQSVHMISYPVDAPDSSGMTALCIATVLAIGALIVILNYLNVDGVLVECGR